MSDMIASMDKHPVEVIAEACGGTITSGGILPDGSGFATVSFPLSKTHWIYEKEPDGFQAPAPMPFRMGSKDAASLIFQSQASNKPFNMVPPIRMTREEFAERIRDAGRYAVRATTMSGTEMDFDPDAMIQNLVCGMLGFWTEDGLSSDAWEMPPDGGRENWKAPAKKEWTGGPPQGATSTPTEANPIGG